jgi:protein-tyrosine-phosphatase
MNILFICNGDVARSQEAEAFVNNLSLAHEAKSAGIEVMLNKPIDPMVIEVMADCNINMEGHFRKFIDIDLVNWADLIVSFVEKSILPEYVKDKSIIFWKIEDPRH